MMQQISALKDSVEPKDIVVLEDAAVLSVKLVVKRGALPFFDQELHASAEIPIDFPQNGQGFGPLLEDAWRRALESMRVEAKVPPAIRPRRVNGRKK